MKTISLFLVSLASVQVLAAVPKKNLESPKPLEFAQEILSMPEANRKQIATEKANELYPSLIELSKLPDQAMETRWKALTLAAYLGKDRALSVLEANLKSSEWFMRNAALVGLRIHHPVKAQNAAKALLKDKALVVRSAAVEVMGSNLDSKTRDLLWEEMEASYNFRKSQSLWIRGQILSQLAQFPQEREMGLFVKALKDKDSSMHAGAIGALEKITQKNLGTAQQKMSEKRSLWLQWAKANPEVSNL